MNILIGGNKILVGSRTAELTLVDYPTAERRTTRMCGAMDDRCEKQPKK